VLEAFNDSPTINNVGQVAFKAYGSAPSDGSMPISGVFRSTEGRLETIAVEGLQDPSGKGHFVSFERPSINDHGQVVFMGAVELPESNEVNIGIYFYDDEMGLTQVVQPGDEIAGKRIRHVAAELYGFQANLFDSGFNQFGQVGFRFTLEDGQIGSAIWSPYPSGDFTADGVVDQADLDLVLLSWGSPFEQLGAGWHSNPPGAFVDQRELDHVLLNWGTTTSPRIASGSIPEPSGWSIALCICPFWLACAGARRTNQVALGGRSILY
jgi:hypothetical protein